MERAVAEKIIDGHKGNELFLELTGKMNNGLSAEDVMLISTLWGMRDTFSTLRFRQFHPKPEILVQFEKLPEYEKSDAQVKKIFDSPEVKKYMALRYAAFIGNEKTQAVLIMWRRVLERRKDCEDLLDMIDGRLKEKVTFGIKEVRRVQETFGDDIEVITMPGVQNVVGR